MNKPFTHKRETLQPEYKSLPGAAPVIEGRAVTTLFSVAGNEDVVGDIVHPGAFAQTMAQRGTKVFHLWQHTDEPPIAVVKALREIPREALPPAILDAYPDAQGGAEAVSEFLPTPRGEEIFQAIRAGAPFEASFAFDPIRFDYTTVGDRQIRNLREVRLWEISTVLWGANGATLGSKTMPGLDLLYRQLLAHIDALKSGARHSAADVHALNQIHHAVVDLGATLCKGKKDDAAAGDDADATEDAEKSRAAFTALTHAQAQIHDLELYLLAR